MSTVILAVIPARGGSKSIPHKNVVLVAGKPLIAWTIEVALKSPSLQRVIVSTDDPEIANVAQHYGAELPFTRPIHLALDDTPSIDVVVHTIRWVEEHENYRPDFVMLLQPTSPLRTAEDIEEVIRIALEKKGDSVVSVCIAHNHPYWTKRIAKNGTLVGFLPKAPKCTRRQGLPPAYALNGAIYLARREVLLNQRTLYTEKTYAYIMPQERSLDIDTPWDLYLADLILKDRMKRESD